MQFELQQYAKIILKRQSVHSKNLILGISREVQEFEQAKTNKYLWNYESGDMKHQQMKQTLKKEYSRRFNWKVSCLVLRYSFGIIHWRFEETRKINNNNRKILTM